jgi:NAD(P)-dependent dehydrogenase (short-subunit alcohol dehydrogenase family)/quinol monooxygenase YgiN
MAASPVVSSGKRAVIIGGGDGIGRAIVRALGRLGVGVFIGDINEAAAAAAAAELRGNGAEAWAAQCDIANDVSVSAFADAAFATLGRIDLLFNHAGASVGGLLEEIGSEDWQWMLNINLVGLGRSCRAFLPRMTAQGGGHIVNTSSGLGLFHDLPAAAPYIASKAGIIAYSRALAVYSRNRKIGVSVFCPDITATAFLGAGRLIGIPPAIAEAGMPADRIQTPDAAAQLLIDGLMAGDFLISAVPGTRAKLQAMADAMLAPASDCLPAAGAVPIVQQGALRIPADKQPEALQAFAIYVEDARRHDGCMFYEAGIDPLDPAIIKVFEVWRDQAAIDAHAFAPETLPFMERLFALGASDFRLTRIAG